ncbi:MAG TPA: SET domain-containing protein-lysine N-methyltransferase [Gemmatimonadales bacterium]|nr:SET domain-containing protein-lysine N-methyltransferase [Gemmatimonadales bacterium]
MKVCVLQPDYSTSAVDYRHYDPPRDLAPLLPGHQVDHVFLNKLTTHRQLRQLATQGYDIFVNLCEGYLDWDIPSIDVIDALARLRLPYTGPTALLYDPSKPLMKYVAHTAGVTTPAHVVVGPQDDAVNAAQALRYPLFVKPSHAGDSLGVDEASLVTDPAALRAKVAATIAEFGEALVEEYLDGREFTVLVLGAIECGQPAIALAPVEYRFPAGPRFKTYAHKTSDQHAEANRRVENENLATHLRNSAVWIFNAFGGVGYARLDFRMDATGQVHFLEINFTCSVFYTVGSEGSADHILALDGMGQAGFLRHIIAEGMARHRRATAPFRIGKAMAGYGIFATRDLAEGEVVYRGEGRAQRIVTARHAATWSEADQLAFRRYAYPLSDEVFILWDNDPSAWAPQNHSCEPNTRFEGLDVVASCPIANGEELTLDYATFMNENGEPFDCHCGAASCRGMIVGVAGNTLTMRERERGRRS